MAPLLMTYRELLDRIDRDRTPGRMSRLVAVDGHGGAGKSTFAQRLAAHAERATVVAVDEFAHGSSRAGDRRRRVGPSTGVRRSMGPGGLDRNPREICLQRGLQRDGQDARPLLDAWFAAEDDYVGRDRPSDKADLTVDGAPSIDHDPTSNSCWLTRLATVGPPGRARHDADTAPPDHETHRPRRRR